MKQSKQVDINEQRMQPFDTDTEWAVLATLMHYNDKYSLFADLLDESLFYYEKEKAMFKCIVGVINSGNATDINSLWHYAQSNDVGYSLLRNDFVDILSSSNKVTIEQDIYRLRDMEKRRRCWRFLQESSQRMLDLTCNLDDEINTAMTMMGEVQGDTGTDGIVSDNETLDDVSQDVDVNREGKKRGFKTGFSLFDKKYLLRPETLTIIAAFTSVGKSALALNIVQSVASTGVACAYYSLEMSRKELASRRISAKAEMTANTILNKPLTDEQAAKVKDVIRQSKGLPIYYDDRATVDFNSTMRSIRVMVNTRDVRLVVIDYLQIYAQVADDPEKSISYMARTAKNIAKELGIAIILISQLNRSALHPSLNMLRGSGQIEESADNVVLIDRPDAYPDNKVTKYEGQFSDSPVKGTAKLILAKGRGVGIGSQLVKFEGKYTRFSEIPKPDDAGHYEEQNEELPF